MRAAAFATIGLFIIAFWAFVGFLIAYLFTFDDRFEVATIVCWIGTLAFGILFFVIDSASRKGDRADDDNDYWH